MAREKKDGRYINYYIDREIYERFIEYAESKGQTATTALERILKQYLDERLDIIDDERIKKDSSQYENKAIK